MLPSTLIVHRPPSAVVAAAEAQAHLLQTTETARQTQASATQTETRGGRLLHCVDHFVAHPAAHPAACPLPEQALSWEETSLRLDPWRRAPTPARPSIT